MIRLLTATPSPAPVPPLLDPILSVWNPVAWAVSNLVVVLIFGAAGMFVLLYLVFFNPWKTTAGKLVLNAFIAIFVFGALVFIGVFVNPRQPWYVYPGDTFWWRPTVRLAGYGFIFYTFFELAKFVIVRRFWPERIPRRAEDTLEIRPGEEIGRR